MHILNLCLIKHDTKAEFFLYWAVLSVISIIIFIVSNIIIIIIKLYCLLPLE